jgi:flavin reductase (DIM6/NTAB) family NADH-FMN oxidoreductase RutF
MLFERIDIRETGHPIKLIADEWALLSAGHAEDWNTMTISWGGVGELWGRDVAFVFVRPQRHTLRYIESNDYFTLSFGLSREVTSLCGKCSGRDFALPNGKIAEAGLTAYVQGGAVWPAETKLVLVCKKIAKQTLEPAGFLDPAIEKNYAAGDYHFMFVGEIIESLKAV